MTMPTKVTIVAAQRATIQRTISSRAFETVGDGRSDAHSPPLSPVALQLSADSAYSFPPT